MKGRFGNDNSSDNHTSILAGSKFKNSEDAEDEMMFEEHETIHTTSQRIIKTKKGGEGRLGDRDRTQERSLTFPSQLNL